MLGWDKLLEYASSEWAGDIKAYQLPHILKGLGPMHHVTQLGMCTVNNVYSHVVPDSVWHGGPGVAPLPTVPGGWTDHVGTTERGHCFHLFYWSGTGRTLQSTVRVRPINGSDGL